MIESTPMTAEWGMDQIGTNVFNASLTAWKAAAVQGLAAEIVFGFLPLLIAGMIFMRTKHVAVSLFMIGIVSGGLQTFELLSSKIAGINYLIMGFGIVIVFGNWYRSR